MSLKSHQLLKLENLVFRYITLTRALDHCFFVTSQDLLPKIRSGRSQDEDKVPCSHSSHLKASCEGFTSVAPYLSAIFLADH